MFLFGASYHPWPSLSLLRGMLVHVPIICTNLIISARLREQSWKQMRRRIKKLFNTLMQSKQQFQFSQRFNVQDENEMKPVVWDWYVRLGGSLFSSESWGFGPEFCLFTLFFHPQEAASGKHKSSYKQGTWARGHLFPAASGVRRSGVCARGSGGAWEQGCRVISQTVRRWSAGGREPKRDTVDSLAALVCVVAF